ncbi:MAG: putative GTP-binding protein EngB [Desulfonauticus sp. 38_4375]|nr:MAG: putative GTP-binding protein EngB [Desulfonauticus sp. 38_4375]
MMKRTLKLEKTIYTLEQLTIPPISQVAIAGRSNVGKSSLLNCLAGQKKLAKISSSPGKTRSLNFYLVEPDNFYLVDLPGYGYAKCSKQEREKWAQLINSYLSNNAYLKAMAVLLDSRLKPQSLDLELISFLENNQIPLIPVLTKVDKCKQKKISASLKNWQVLLNKSAQDIILFSSKTGKGKNKLWQAIVNKAK